MLGGARRSPAARRAACPVPGSGTGGRADLPGRARLPLLPRLLPHVPDTMRRIPRGGRTRLRPPRRRRRASCSPRPAARNELIAAGARAGVARGPRGRSSRFLFELTTALGIPPHEHALLVERLLTLLTSCDERRYQQWELQSWWEFVGAEQRSEALRKFLADGLTRTLVAARAREISARTGGLILAAAAVRPHARRRPRRPRARRAHERGVDRPVGRPPARPGRRPAPGRAGRRASTVRSGRIAGVTTPAARHGDRRLLRRGAAGRGAAAARLAARCARRAAARRARPARDAVDERDPVLPRSRRAARARPRDLHRLRVGADVDLAGAVLGRARPRALRRRAREGDPLGRRLGLGAPGRAYRQGRRCVHAARRSAPRSGASSPTTSTTGPARARRARTC